MINIYDANNIMRRSLESRGQMPGTRPMTLRQRYEEVMAQPVGTQIWCWDGREHNERRREIYPPYKTNREPMAEDIFSHIRLWRELLGHTHALQFEVHGWEADDVIGTLVRGLSSRGSRVRVHTNDMDYGQIAHLCELNGVNMKGVPPRWVALYKSMVGDSSDRIAGIPGFGPKRWVEMEPHWQTIENAIRAGRPEGFADLPFKPAVAAWLTVPENIELLQKMLLVTHFQNVPEDELIGGLTRGTPNRHAANLRLMEFFL